MWAPLAEIEAELDPDAEGDDIWSDFTDTLTQGLVEIAPENLLRSLAHRVSFSDCSTARFRALLGKLGSLYGKDVSKVTAPMLVYFARGVLVSYEQKENSALVGFDTARRKEAFLEHYPEAEDTSDGA